MEKIIRAFGYCLLIGLFSLLILQSCKPKRHFIKPTFYIRGSNPPGPIIFYHLDTAYHKTPKLETATRASFKDNYNQYFVPEFNKLNAVIDKQAVTLNAISESNAKLSQILQNMRERSIRRNDSSQRVFLQKDSEFEVLQKRFSNEQRLNSLQNRKQIIDLNNLADVLIVASVCMLIGISFLFIVVRILWRKVNKLSILYQEA